MVCLKVTNTDSAGVNRLVLSILPGEICRRSAIAFFGPPSLLIYCTTLSWRNTIQERMYTKKSSQPFSEVNSRDERYIRPSLNAEQGRSTDINDAALEWPDWWSKVPNSNDDWNCMDCKFLNLKDSEHSMKSCRLDFYVFFSPLVLVLRLNYRELYCYIVKALDDLVHEERLPCSYSTEWPRFRRGAKTSSLISSSLCFFLQYADRRDRPMHIS